MLFLTSVQEAVQLARKEKKLLFLLLLDDSHQSRIWLESVQDTPDVPNCIALKLLKGSQEAMWLGQLYKLLEPPSAYFLSPVGMMVARVEPEAEPKTLLLRLDALRISLAPTASGGVAKEEVPAAAMPEPASPAASGGTAKMEVVTAAVPEPTSRSASGGCVNEEAAAAAVPKPASPGASGGVAKDDAAEAPATHNMEAAAGADAVDARKTFAREEVNFSSTRPVIATLSLQKPSLGRMLSPAELRERYAVFEKMVAHHSVVPVVSAASSAVGRSTPVAEPRPEEPAAQQRPADAARAATPPAPAAAENDSAPVAARTLASGQGETTLLFRFGDGSSVKRTVDAAATLKRVRMLVREHMEVETLDDITFVQVLPRRRVFGADQDDASLADLGLGPGRVALSVEVAGSAAPGAPVAAPAPQDDCSAPAAVPLGQRLGGAMARLFARPEAVAAADEKDVGETKSQAWEYGPNPELERQIREQGRRGGADGANPAAGQRQPRPDISTMRRRRGYASLLDFSAKDGEPEEFWDGDSTVFRKDDTKRGEKKDESHTR